MKAGRWAPYDRSQRSTLTHRVPPTGAYGGRLARQAQTPHLDSLARSGALFSSAFCTTSLCMQGHTRALALRPLAS